MTVRRFIPLVAGLLACGCSDSFLRGLSDTAEPNDGGACSPNGRVLDFVLAPEEDRILLSWTTDATDADGIIIERRDDSPTIQWGELTRVPPETRTFSDFGAQRGRRFVYRAATFRQEGAEICRTPPSAELTISTFPVAPSDVQLSLGPGGVVATWQDDNAFVDTYELEQSPSGTLFVAVASIAAGVPKQLVDGTVPESATLTYRVVAANASGRSPSPELMVTSQGPNLAWDGPVALGAQCTLEVPGVTGLASGTNFFSATGSVDVAFSNAVADASGFTAILSSPAAGNVVAQWSVEDDQGGETSISRAVSLEEVSVRRGVERSATGAQDDVFTSGSQALLPACGTCTGQRGRVGLGGHFGCALSPQGEALCWGENIYMQLGRNDKNNGEPQYPAQVCAGGLVGPCDTPMLGYDVAVGAYVACARALDGTIKCWGDGSTAALGSGVDAETSIATAVCTPELSTGVCRADLGFVSIATQPDAACGVKADGSVWCWGLNSDSILGNGSTVTVESPHPTPVCATGMWDGATCAGGAQLTGAESVVMGADHVCAKLATGEAVCWGDNSNGQLGDGNGGGFNDESPNPVPVGGGTPLGNIASLSAGESFSCALLNDGTAQCWGSMANGRLGNGRSEFNEALLPDDLCATGETGVDCVPLTSITALELSDLGGCVILDPDDAVLCWGTGDSGAAGNGVDGPDVLNPSPVCASGVWNGTSCGSGTELVGARAIDGGSEAHCAILEPDDRLMCWGDGFFGQLGTGESEQYLNPTPVCLGIPAPGELCTPMVDVAAVDINSSNGCAVTGDNIVRCWGGAQNDLLGDGSVASAQGDNPFALPACASGRGAECVPFTGLQDLVVGGAHTCGLRADGSVACWGINAHGEAGSGGFSFIQPPGTVCQSGQGPGCVPLLDVVALVAGGMDESPGFPELGNPTHGHTCALHSDGTVSCWGDNRHGQTGTGSRTTTAGECISSSCPIGFFCEGGFCFEQFEPAGGVPNPDFVRCGETCPDPGAPLTGVVSMGAGLGHTCAVLATGQVACWGRNRESQLADDNPTDKTLPTLTPVTQAIQVVAGALHTCALLEDHSVRCWGENEFGQLGDGTNQRRTAPTTVCVEGQGLTCVPLGGVASLSAGWAHTCALLQSGRVACWGSNGFGQLGDGNLNSLGNFVPRPTPVCAPNHALGPPAPDSDCADGDSNPYVCDEFFEGVVALTSGGLTSCAIVDDGRISCWGRNLEAQVGSDEYNTGVCTPTDGVCATSDGLCADTGAFSDFGLQECTILRLVP